MSSFGKGPAAKPRGVLAGTGLTPETQKLLQGEIHRSHASTPSWHFTQHVMSRMLPLPQTA